MRCGCREVVAVFQIERKYRADGFSRGAVGASLDAYADQITGRRVYGIRPADMLPEGDPELIEERV